MSFDGKAHKVIKIFNPKFALVVLNPSPFFASQLFDIDKISTLHKSILFNECRMRLCAKK